MSLRGEGSIFLPCRTLILTTDSKASAKWQQWEAVSGQGHLSSYASTSIFFHHTKENNYPPGPVSGVLGAKRRSLWGLYLWGRGRASRPLVADRNYRRDASLFSLPLYEPRMTPSNFHASSTPGSSIPILATYMHPKVKRTLRYPG